MNRRFFLKISGLLSLMTSSKVFAFINVLMLRRNQANPSCPAGPVYNLTISANAQNYNIYTAAGSPAGCCTVYLTINAGVYVWSDSVTLPALEFGALPAGSKVFLTNNGYIMGKGGFGGCWDLVPSVGNGGPAINMTCAASINSQTGYILGGGGGGGFGSTLSGGGGGAGGGIGGYTQADGTTAAGGTPGNNGATYSGSMYGPGGGGGRVVPGTTTTGGTTTTYIAGSGGSAGGAGGAYASKGAATTIGGNGGAIGATGGTGFVTPASFGTAGGGGGGYGADGGPGITSSSSSPFGTGGKSVVLNGYSVSWTGGFGANKVYGAIS